MDVPEAAPGGKRRRKQAPLQVDGPASGTLQEANATEEGPPPAELPLKRQRKSVQFADEPEVAPDPVYSATTTAPEGNGDLQDFATGVLDAIGSIEEDPRDKAAKERGKRRKKSFKQRMREAAATGALSVVPAEADSAQGLLRGLVERAALQEHSLANVLRAVERGREGLVVISSDFPHLKVMQKERLYYGLQEGDVPHVVLDIGSQQLGMVVGRDTAMALYFRLDESTRPQCDALRKLGTALVKDWL